MFFRCCTAALLVLATTLCGLRSEDGKDDREWQALFNGKDTSGWKLRDNTLSVVRYVDSTGKTVPDARRSIIGQTDAAHDVNGRPLPTAKVVVQEGKKVVVDAYGKVIVGARIVTSGGRETVVDGKGTVIQGARMVREKKPNRSGWKVVDGELRCIEPHTGNDLVSEQTFQDFELHIEFQATANSGVYLQGRYEIQIDNSFGRKPSVVEKDGNKVARIDPHQCGAIYGRIAPSKNMARPPSEWQSYDVVFRAPRGEKGKVKEKARVTLVWNGEKVIDDAAIDGPTGGSLDNDVLQPGPLLLQGDHGKVNYRNIKIRPCAKK